MLAANLAPINAGVGVMSIPLSAGFDVAAGDSLQQVVGNETVFAETGVAKFSNRFEQWMVPYAAQLHAINILSPEITFAFASAAVCGVSTLGLPIDMGTLDDSERATPMDFLRALMKGLGNLANGFSWGRARPRSFSVQAPSDGWVEGRTVNVSFEGFEKDAAALPSQVSGTRKTFSPELVVFKRGEVFVDLSSSSSDAAPVTLEIARGENAVVPGTSGSHTIFIGDSHVSAKHARVIYLPSERALVISDRGSMNGTFVDIGGGKQKVFGEERFEPKPLAVRAIIRVGETLIKIDLPLVAENGAARAVPEITRRVPKPVPVVPPFNAETVHTALAHILQMNKLEARISVNGDIVVEVRPKVPSVTGSIKFIFPLGTSSDKVSAISESLIDRIRPFKAVPTLDVVVTFMPRQDLYDKVKYFGITSGTVENGGVINFVAAMTDGSTRVSFDVRVLPVGVIGGISDKDFGSQAAGLPKIEIMVPIENDPAKMQRMLRMALNKAENAVGDLGLRQETEDELAGIFRPYSDRAGGVKKAMVRVKAVDILDLVLRCALRRAKSLPKVDPQGFRCLTGAEEMQDLIEKVDRIKSAEGASAVIQDEELNTHGGLLVEDALKYHFDELVSTTSNKDVKRVLEATRDYVGQRRKTKARVIDIKTQEPTDADSLTLSDVVRIINDVFGS